MVHLWEGVRIALSALRANKLRTFLTLLGNIVGVLSVVAVASIIGGMDQYVRREIASEGTSVFRVQRLDELEILRSLDDFLASLHNPRLTLADAEYLRDRIPSAVSVGAMARESARFEYRGRAVEGRVQGRSAEYPLLDKYPLAAGRHFTELEVEHSRAAAVLGWDVAETLFPHQDPLGKGVRIDGRRFTVAGVIEDKGSVLGQSRNLYALVPITTYLKLLSPRQSITIPVAAADVDLVPQAMEEARFAMRVRHRLRPRENDDFAVTSSAQLLSLWEKVSQSIFAALIGIVSISLVVGGIVIMNVMLVSVTERTREVGLRKAVGARRRDVLWQFLVEAMTLSLVGGVLGILLGFGAASLISALTPLPYTIKAWAIVAALAVTGAVGLFFGIYPANRAAGLDPIEALRYE